MVHLDNLDIKSVETVYQQVKDGVQIEALYGVVMGIAVVLFFERLIKLHRENSKEGKLNAKGLFDMCWLYIVIAFICVLIPYLLGFIESLLGDLQSHLVNTTSIDNMSHRDHIKEMIAKKQELYPESPGITDGLAPWCDWLATFVATPVIYITTKYLYSFMMVGRYFWLLMLEIVSPIAFVCLMNEKTHQFFYTWCKHMILCYLMVPFFLLANTFADSIILTDWTGETSLFYALCAQFLIKLSLFNLVKSRLFNLI